MTTQERELIARRWAPSYRAHCPSCRRSGREFRSYGGAEQVAQGHADKNGHATYVIDQYGLRVIGSGRHPGESRETRMP